MTGYSTFQLFCCQSCRSWIAHCCCGHGAVGSNGAQWCSFCGWQKLTVVLLSISFFYFQCFHCASVQFQLQYPGTLPRKCAGGTGWNGWRQSDWHLGVMPCRALSCFLLRSSLGTEGIWLWDDLQRKCSLGWGPLLYVYRLRTRRIDRTLWWGLWYDGTDWKKFSSDLLNDFWYSLNLFDFFNLKDEIHRQENCFARICSCLGRGPTRKARIHALLWANVKRQYEPKEPEDQKTIEAREHQNTMILNWWSRWTSSMFKYLEVGIYQCGLW